jgi:hypothetical protein
MHNNKVVCAIKIARNEQWQWCGYIYHISGMSWIHDCHVTQLVLCLIKHSIYIRLTHNLNFSVKQAWEAETLADIVVDFIVPYWSWEIVRWLAPIFAVARRTECRDVTRFGSNAPVNCAGGWPRRSNESIQSLILTNRVQQVSVAWLYVECRPTWLVLCRFQWLVERDRTGHAWSSVRSRAADWSAHLSLRAVNCASLSHAAAPYP